MWGRGNTTDRRKKEVLDEQMSDLELVVDLENLNFKLLC